MDLPRPYMISLMESDDLFVKDEFDLIKLYKDYMEYRENDPRCPILPEDDENLKYEAMIMLNGSDDDKQRL